MIRNFHIELAVANVDTPERMDAIRQAIQAAGRMLLGNAVLICGGEEPAPEVTLYGEDFTEGRTDIDLDEQED